MKGKDSFKDYVKFKSRNSTSIRVLYKKVGQAPKVKIIDNVFKLKKAIVKKNLDIIPYENLYIVCNNRKVVKNMLPNIALNLRSIYGDLILVGIDKKKREFKGLSQEDILWYSTDLMNKGYMTKGKILRQYLKKELNCMERNFDNNDNNYLSYFQNKLITVLVNIELTLANLLKNSKNTKK